MAFSRLIDCGQSLKILRRERKRLQASGRLTRRFEAFDIGAQDSLFAGTHHQKLLPKSFNGFAEQLDRDESSLLLENGEVVTFGRYMHFAYLVQMNEE